MRYDRRPNIAIAVWVNLCEGIACHFSEMGPEAAAKILRAKALADASGQSQLAALTAAWAAHMAYLDASFETMASHLARALQLADAEHHGARSRACLVSAQAFHFAGRLDLAQPWYAATRRHALVDGDDATLGAMLHNSSWLHAALLRQNVLLDGVSAVDSRHALMSADSALHFDRFVGTTSLQALAPMLRAQILAVLDRPREAIALYDAHFDASLDQGLRRTLEADLLADRAWCHAAAGDLELARRHAAAAELQLNPAGHFVDRVFAHRRLAQVWALLGEPGRAGVQQAHADSAAAGHRREQRRIVAALVGALEPHLGVLGTAKAMR